MPPEPLPWDRKDDFIRERKHERTELFGSAPRWRNSSTTSQSSHYGSRDFARWGSPDLRRPPGHGKQGGCHPFEETSGHGNAPTRSCDRMFGDETCRSSVSLCDLTYGRSSRENRGSFAQRNWKSHSLEPKNGSANAPGRPQDINIDQRSVDNLVTCPSNSDSDPANTCDQVQSKDQHDNKASGNNRLNTGHLFKREASLGSVDWKPLKWTRSGSLSSRDSGFSQSSGLKSLGAVDSGEQRDENPLKNAILIHSPPGNAGPSVTSAVHSEEGTSRKKSRLGWGEGLAKYEKKKAEGPDVSANKDGSAASSNSLEAVQSFSSNLVDKSPRNMGFFDCASPATPSSIACSSSPGAENSSFGKTAYMENGISNMFSSPSLGSQSHLEGSSFNLERLDNISMDNLGSSLNELLQFADIGSMNSSFVQPAAMNKLLIWKGDILKALEMTETEIDLLENELKVLKSESGSLSHLPAVSSSLPVENDANLYKEPDSASVLISRPASLQIDSCEGEMVDKPPVFGAGLGEVNVDAKGQDHDSPGTATSKAFELISLVKNRPSSNVDRHVKGSGDMVGIRSVYSVPSSSEIHVAVSVDVSVPEKGEKVTLASGECDLDDGDSILCSDIFASNKESAKEASDVFNKLLPGDCSCVDMLGLSNISGWQDKHLVKQKFAARRQSLRCKERVLALKFKAFLNLWREDMRQLSMRKYRAKSQKKVESGLRGVNGGCQKQRTLTSSWFSLPGGNLSLAPASDIVNLTGKLLSDSQLKPCRDVLKMPALILEEKEKVSSRFFSSNGLVEDPCAVEKEKAMINTWTSEEKETFMDKFARYGKDFRKIASFLDHKTTADCVEFYYKNHKSDCFEKMKKPDGSKLGKSTANTYLVASSKNWNRGMNATSLDILGTVSAIAARSENISASWSTTSGRIFLRKHSDSKLCGDDNLESSSSFDLPEKETFAAGILAGICGSLSSEAMSSCITTCVDPGETYKDLKSQRVDSAGRRSSISDITQAVDDDTCSDDTCGEIDSGDWTDEERTAFIQAVSSYGKDFARISRCVRTRSQDQCRVFFSKTQKCLGLDLIHVSERVSVSDDANGDGSDMEDDCVLETCSVVCNDKLDNKMGGDLPGSPLITNHDASDRLGSVKLEADLNRSENDNGMCILDQKDDVKTISPDTCEMGDGPEVVFKDGNSAMNENNVESGTQSVQQTEKDLVVSADTEDKRDSVNAQAVSSSVVESVAPPPLIADFQANGIVEVAMDISRKDTEQEKPSVTETKSNKIVCKQCDVHAFVQDSLLKDDNATDNRDVDTSTSSLQNFGCLIQVPIEVRPPVPHPQEKSATIQNEEKPNKETLPNLNLEKGNQGRELVSHVPVHQLVNHIDSLQILSGYPLQIPTKKEMDGNVIHGQVAEAKTMKSDVRITNSHLARGFYFSKCNGTIPSGSMTESLVFSAKGQKPGPPRTHSHSLSGTEKPCRNGDVKLFGKILTTHENGEKGTTNHHLKQCGRPSPVNVTGHHSVDGNWTTMKFNCNNQLGLENIPKRGYAFWDENRIQTTFSSLPDSAILMAKYPDAFANYPASSTKMEQQQVLHSLVRSSNEHNNLNGMSVCPPREMCASNGVLDSHMYRNGHDGTRTHPFILGHNLLFSELQRRNEFEAISNLVQRPSRGVSDAVAAIKMQYAKTEQYGGQNGNLIRQEEPLKGKGETGR